MTMRFAPRHWGRSILLLILLGSVICAATVEAAAPDAGQLLREQEPQRPAAPLFPPAEEERARPPLTDTGLRVTVRAFRFTGYEGLATEAELQAVVAGLLGRSLGFGELQQAAADVTTFLREKKSWFLARAYLPAQDVTDGIIEIAILAGRSQGSITIQRDASVRIHEWVLQAIGATAIRPGEPLRNADVERAVLLMNDLPGVAAQASLAAGTTPGSTGVQVDVKEGPLFGGNIWEDNQGNRYSGTWRSNGLLSVNDPLGVGDQLTLLMTGAEDIAQGRASYSVPLSASGLRGSVAYSGMYYRLARDLKAQGLAGSAHTWNAGLAYPLYRSRTQIRERSPRRPVG